MSEEQQEIESIADSLSAVLNASDGETETSEEAQAVSEEAAPEETEANTEVEQEDNDISAEPDTVFQAPEHWSSEEREGFDALAPEAQELLLTRDAQFQKGYQEKAQSISAISEALEPWKDALVQRGVTADQAIRALFAAQHQLDANPLQGILQIAQSYGIQDQLQNSFAPKTDEQDFTDPEIKALKTQIGQLQGQLNQTNQGIQNQNVGAVQQQIDSFSQATDESGNLVHPHFEQVKPLMAQFVQSGDTMDQAYEKAVWTVPDFRTAQASQKQEKSAEQKAQKVKQAKKAARGVKANGKADPSEGAESLSLTEMLSDAYRQHSA